MGYVTAVEMRRFLPEDQALAWHLQYNHFPPISLIFLPAIREALASAREGDFCRRIKLPTGKLVAVADVVEQAHLHAFLDVEEDA
jgi:hypothetical protein